MGEYQDTQPPPQPPLPSSSSVLPPTHDARDLLSSRTIPTMTLSTSSNPLTLPLPPISSTLPSEHANARFAVEGNALITGGAGALGLTSARALLKHGLSGLAILDLPATLDSSAASIHAMQASFPDRKIITFSLDVTNASLVEDVFSQAATVLGSIDMLLCFAGIVGCHSSLSIPSSTFAKILDVNLLGSFLCAQAAAKYMIAQGTGGCILFTASISAHVTNFPQPQAAYNVSKAGVKHLTKNLAAEWAVHGIRVNCISPGYMDTVLNAGQGLKEIREVWASRNPMGRMGDVEEITGPVVMLCSCRAGRYVTGIDVVVDGGALTL